jgi:hypothetical protein
VLAVSIDPVGTVVDVRVLEGFEPFASTAIESVRGARFIPATRAGKPISVTVRYRIEFTKPVAAPPPPPEPEPTTDPASTPPPIVPKPKPVDDVIVRGGRGTIGIGAADALARTEVRQLPGAFGDPFRAIESLPGTTPLVTGLPYFYVRGAPPGNVGFFFDGIRIPYMFHFGLGPAVIHPALIAKTELYRGGYPAAFGRYAGAIVSAQAMPPSSVLHAEGQLRLVDVGALVETPFANGKGTALVAGRYSFTAAMFSLLSSDVTLDYRDYQTRIAYALDDRNTLSVLALGAYDYASQRQEIVDPTFQPTGPADFAKRPMVEIDRTLFASEFHRVDVRWDRTLQHGGQLRVATTLGYDRTDLRAHRSAGDLMTAARVELTQPLSRTALFRAGADVVVDRFVTNSIPVFADDDDVVLRQRAVFTDRTDFATGARADMVLTTFRALELVPGVRVDVFGSGVSRAVAVDPRLAARFSVTDRVRIIHAYGVASQPPSTPITLPGIAIASLRGGLQRSVQTSAGVEVDLPSDFSATGTVFHNAFRNLNDALETAQLELSDIERSDGLLTKSHGSAVGLELGLRRKLSRRISGLAAYTLSHSNRLVEGRRFASAYDRPHVLSAALTVDLGRQWRAGTRFVGYSGIPARAETPKFAEQIVGIPPGRTPPFFRLDLRLEKRWQVGRSGYITGIIEMLNATLQHEVTGYSCGRTVAAPGIGGVATCSERIIGPIALPSIGVEGGF